MDNKQSVPYLSDYFDIPFFDLGSVLPDSLPTKLISIDLIKKHHVLPLFKRGNQLFIATSNPIDTQALEEVKFNTGLNTSIILVEEHSLTEAIDVIMSASESSVGELLGEELDDISIAQDSGSTEDDDDEVDDAPIVRFVNKILLDAVKNKSSDIHLEPYKTRFRIRFRRDGKLYEDPQAPPINIASRIVSRIKVMSGLDIAERRIPQDGAITISLSQTRSVNFRISTCPTLFGEKVVIRVLDSTGANFSIDTLGFSEQQKGFFMEAISQPYGMILVTGPTGSGKTVSLYTGLNILNNPERNISTVEDPVEINVEGINQVSINNKAGLTFANALRSFLRQDPDVIMVGEIRDAETANIAVKAAQTGHLVLSTLHTNDAPQAISRLMQMGIEPFNVASSLNLITAQRLVRKLCNECKKEDNHNEKTYINVGFKKDEIASLKTYSPVGCSLCNRGYDGRVGIYQMMPVTKKMRALILGGCDDLQISALSMSEGVDDLRESGLKKVRDGITSLQEIVSVTMRT